MKYLQKTCIPHGVYVILGQVANTITFGCNIYYYMNRNHDLIIRLNRIEGQIRALRQTLENDTAHTDCIKTLSQIKAVTNALKHFGEAFSHSAIKRCFAEHVQQGSIANRVENIISSAFSM